MATTYSDQFFLIDPYSPPPPGTAINFVRLDLIDQNDDGLIGGSNFDSVDGSDIISSWDGDTVTINVPGVGDVTYTGTTFYLADGRRVFTPNDGQVLQDGTLVSTSWVTTDAPLIVPSELGPTCFTPGAQIVTDRGPAPIETLAPGDRVRTRDHGFQPVRWIGRATFAAEGIFAPVLIKKGALGNRTDLKVSQQHRILVTGWRAQLFLGQDEALIAAHHLVNGDSIRLAPGGSVTYIHLLFDQHEIITASGLHSESFHPAAAIETADRDTLREVAQFFPELYLDAAVRIPAARQVARRHEAQLLAS